MFPLNISKLARSVNEPQKNLQNDFQSKDSGSGLGCVLRTRSNVFVLDLRPP